MKTKIACRIVLAISAITFAVAGPQDIRAQKPRRKPDIHAQPAPQDIREQPQDIRAQEPLDPATPKVAVPDEETQKKATALVRDVYSEEYQEAQTAAQKGKLARKLIEDAAQEKKPAGQYVMLRIARDMAAGVGDGEAAFQAIEELDRRFTVDALQMKADVLRMSSTLTGRTPDAYKNLTEAALPLLDEAIRQDRFDLAAGMVDAAKAAAVRSRDPKLRSQVAAVADRVDNARASYQKVSDAVARLKEKPTDSDANLLLGKYHCFNKLDWETGLPMLALGGDDVLKKIAELDLAEPKESEAQASVGDAWWDFAEQADANAKSAAQQRAKHWYELAVPGLAGLAKGKLEKRLRLLPEADGVSARSRPPLAVAPFNIANATSINWARLYSTSARVEAVALKPVILKESDDKNGWQRVPEAFKRHRTGIYMGTGKDNGVADFEVLKDGTIFLACNYDYQGNSSGN